MLSTPHPNSQKPLSKVFGKLSDTNQTRVKIFTNEFMSKLFTFLAPTGVSEFIQGGEGGIILCVFNNTMEGQ
jgi:hypothetical protein